MNHTTEEYKGYQFRIEYDSMAQNPFEDWDWPKSMILATNSRDGIMWWLQPDEYIEPKDLCMWHLEGDSIFECPDKTCAECEDTENCEQLELINSIKKFVGKYHWLPVYKYEHSGVAYNTIGFSCPWDSGIAGYIAISKKNFEEEFECEPDEYLRHTVQLLSDYAGGQCYGWVVDAPDGEGDWTEGVESCWGYYGQSGIEAATEEAKATIDSLIKVD